MKADVRVGLKALEALIDVLVNCVSFGLMKVLGVGSGEGYSSFSML
jgi:hypothetical protein